MGLASRNAKARHSAGMDEASYYDFTPGQRVTTPEGFQGTIEEIQEAPFGAETYIVTLDNGMGGGEYRAIDLHSVFETEAMAGSPTTAYVVEALPIEAGEIHVAYEDYPELNEILHDRPPLEHAISVHASAGSVDLYHFTSPESAAAIKASGSWKSKENTGDVFFTTHKDSEYASGFGSARVHARVPSSWINEYNDGKAVLNDEFPNGEKHYAINKKWLGPEHIVHDDEKTAGIRDKLVDGFVKGVPENARYEPGHNASVDWCRFRKYERCMFPKHLDLPATKEAGYAVWIPEDRGWCPRNSWAMQKTCPISQPGPHSGEKEVYPEATEPWSQGGQRIPAGVSIVGMLKEAQIELEAAWKDVRAKAKRIRENGGVRVLSAPTKGTTYLTAEVQGDHGIYLSSIMRQPGKKAVAMWECGCEWAKYAWDRSPQYKGLEGRMCSHVLALMYEGQSREIFGRDITEDRMAPWPRYVSDLPEQNMYIPKVVKFPNTGYEDPYGNRKYPRAASLEKEALSPFLVKYLGSVHRVLDIVGNMLLLDNGVEVHGSEVEHPMYDPHVGLTAMKRVAADGADHNGVMIAICPPLSVCESLAIPDGEPVENMHITMLYLGKTEENDREKLEAAIQHWAELAQPMHGHIGGYGEFINPEGKVQIALIDIPGLEHQKLDLVEVLNGHDIYPEETHGYTPHLTIKYGDEEMPSELPEAATQPFDVTRAVFAWGGEWTHYGLGGGSDTTATLHDQPEGAVPTTDGDAHVDVDYGGVLPDERTPSLSAPPLKDARAGLEWLMDKPSNVDPDTADIAKSARKFLKEGMRAFSPAERQEVIDEGEREGVTASNLDRLDLEGTHYLQLEEALRDQENDDYWL